jgi:hypothetical protein
MNNYQSKLICNASRKGDLFYEQSIRVYSLHIFDQLTEFHVRLPTSYQTCTAVLQSSTRAFVGKSGILPSICFDCDSSIVLCAFLAYITVDTRICRLPLAAEGVLKTLVFACGFNLRGSTLWNEKRIFHRKTFFLDDFVPAAEAQHEVL